MADEKINMDDPLFFLGPGKFTPKHPIVEIYAESVLQAAMANSVPPLNKLVEYVGGLRTNRKPEEYRKRTSAEIIESGYATGCTDRALAFIGIARQLGIPARYVEAYAKEWLEINLNDGMAEKLQRFKDEKKEFIWHLKKTTQQGNGSNYERDLYRAWECFGGNGLAPNQLWWLANGKVGGHAFVDVHVEDFPGAKWRKIEPTTGFIDARGYEHNNRVYVEAGKGLDFGDLYVKNKNGIYAPKPRVVDSMEKMIQIAEKMK